MALVTVAKPPASPYTRSQDVYFEDGTVILVAEKTAFRVHKGLLALHSEVFHDLLIVARPPKGAESFEGCQVVQLCDTRQDLAKFLGLIYNHPKMKPDNFNAWASILRLATKYAIEDLRKTALDAISRQYPATLKEWDSYMGQRKYPENVIVLARETGADILLPAAFYHLCQFSSDQVLGHPGPLISLDDICSLFKGKEKMAYIWPEFRVDMAWSGPSSDVACKVDWTDFTEGVKRAKISSSHILAPNPLYYLQGYSQALNKRGQLCSAHKKTANEQVDIRREKIWDNLPKIFELGTWEPLKKKS